ncbi:D-alanyl-D-alanine carboxypeptidase family protein [Candidatus Soleaferrea massiliensis]|uniref:D-alanyl-D-alanine carboxypeptidase family protein n=1 Tax=Candidatus Soleaferrea massiliensis TaxID=1470354 RepID=UPI0018CDD834|nr:D-alanyl-D-alanine carboxypeptidase family protein [Candidatus Soleaferrea massiliensis]
MKRILSLFCAFCLLGASFSVWAQEDEEDTSPELYSEHVVLMEQSTKKVLYEKNSDEKCYAASLGQLMSMLLVMEAVDSGKLSMDATLRCSDHANSIGGASIWLRAGEEMKVSDLIKAVCIVSANDAVTVLAEAVGGDEAKFVAMMNQKAKDLGMQNTTFVNPTGLYAEGQQTTARDIGIVACELLKYEQITQYTSVWLDSMKNSDGDVELANQNRMVRFYKGATGLKACVSDQAKNCVAASATRGDMTYVAVALGSETSDDRFETAKNLLNYGFENFITLKLPSIESELGEVKVTDGVKPKVALSATPPERLIIDKALKASIEQKPEVIEEIAATVEEGQELGKVVVTAGDTVLTEYPVKAKETVLEMTFPRALMILLRSMVQL